VPAGPSGEDAAVSGGARDGEPADRAAALARLAADPDRLEQLLAVERRSAQMQALAAALAAALTPAQVAAAALEPALTLLGAQGGGLVLRDPPGDGPPTMTIAGVVGYPPDVVARWRRLAVDGSTPAGDAVVSGTAVYLAELGEARRRYPATFAEAAALGTERSWAALPLRAGGEVMGALMLTFAGRRVFAPEDRAFLETVAAQCALAVERTRLYEVAQADRERLRAVLARLPVGVVIGEAPSGRLVLGNAEVERIWRRPFLRSASVGEYSGYRGLRPGGDVPYRPEEWPLARALLTGEVVADEEIDIERGDGTRGTIVVNAAPIRDPDGSVVAGICSFLDITERAEARRRLNSAYEAEREARAAAEAAWSRLDRLQKVTAGLSEAVTPVQVAEVMVQGVLAVLGGTSAWIGVLDEPGRTLVALAASFPVEPGGPAAQIPLSAASPRAEVTRTGTPVWLPSAAEAQERYPGLRAIGIAAGALGVVPLVSHGRPIGAMLLSFDESRELEPEERALVVTLAEQCAQALERARLHQREHHVALTLQQSMLPSALPMVPGLELTGRYRPAVQSLEVGGDWYDVLALPDGRVALTVGDVVGRGLAAATTMGQLRSALAALALSARSPALVLDDLEQFARQVEGARLGTVVYCLFDPVDGTLRYACAGHPPPLVVLPGGGTAYLEEGRSALLCALPPGLAVPRAEGTYRLPPGATLLLYSDGLVERRGESLDVGLRRLADLAGEYAKGGDRAWFERLVDDMLAGSGDDDVALLRVTVTPALVRRLPAEPNRLAGLRRELRGWLAGIGATDDEVADVLLACGEACANAVEHAYREGEGDLTVELALDPDRELWLRVADRGRWRSVPAPGDRGRGLPLMSAVMDAVDVARGKGGTVVTMRRRLGAAVPA
jgi:serine phosphatase RsbU (regulator of sigma subunit)/anti-sigma regulatory factor (Ser/Thr protein kinase)/PAS domain-containing protein